MTGVLHRVLAWLRPERPIRRYRVTLRPNSCAFRRELLREAMLELKRDPAFAPALERRHTSGTLRVR